MGPQPTTIAAVVFDLDGVLLDSESTWDTARRRLVERRGGHWRPDATRAMQGMSSVEWSRYMREELGVPMGPEDIARRVAATVARAYREHLPLLRGAKEAVERLAARWPLGLASSSNRSVIDLVLGRAGLESFFTATVSSEEVARGKPAPDVYLQAARRLGVPGRRCAAVEDSTNGIIAARSAGMLTVAIPNQAFPPDQSALGSADIVLHSLLDLTPETLNLQRP
jgi:HAD superfamily hydrolase (TIGR01509 family)